MSTQYDPTILTHEIYRLLLDKGLPVERTGNHAAAIEGASAILRYLGLDPVIPADIASYQKLDLDGHKSYAHRIHGD